MRATIRQDFDYSTDGLTIMRLRAGEVHDISDSMANGLVEARLIEPWKEPVVAEVTIQDSVDQRPEPVATTKPAPHGVRRDSHKRRG
jgi:hypothetical protein